MPDDLFQPTVGATPVVPLSRPWRVSSLAYPAFFGGPLAITVLGALNARRLGAQSTVPLIVGSGVLVFVALVAFFVIPSDPPASARPAVIVSGLIAYGVQFALVRRADLLHQVRNGEYASLWGPGFLAVLLSGFATGALIVALTS